MVSSQNRGISRIQQRVKELYENNSWNTDPALLILAIQEEVGELSSAWLREGSGYEKISQRKNRSSLFEEIGDLGNLILALCNALNIDFEKAVENTISKVWKADSKRKGKG